MIDFQDEQRGAGLRLVNRLYTRVGLIAGILSLTSVALSRFVFRDHSIPIAVPTALLLILVLSMLLIVRGERRLVARLKASNYSLCPHCGYSLRGHAGQVSCPECGTVSEIEDIETKWRAFRPRISGFLDGRSAS